MRHIVITSCLVAAFAFPVAAQAEDTSQPSLMEEGMRLLFQGLMDEAEPALRELEGLSQDLAPAIRGLVENFGPSLGDILGQIEDFSLYHAPELLPNGDIILRRKTPDELALEDDQGIDL